MPALPLDDAGPYVAAAYVVFLALVVAYVAIMARKLRSLQQQVDDLERDAVGERSGDELASAPNVEQLTARAAAPTNGHDPNEPS